MAGFSITETDGYTLVFEDGSKDTFEVALDTEPLSDVVIVVTSGDPDEAVVSPERLTLTRVSRIRTGGGSLGGVKLAAKETVHDDGQRDHLLGGQGLDWFFARLAGLDNDVVFRTSDELLDLV